VATKPLQNVYEPWTNLDESSPQAEV